MDSGKEASNMESSNEMTKMKLQSSDGKIFEVSIKVAKCSVTIKTMLDDLGMTQEDADQPVPLPNVNSKILEKVLKWCDHHKDDPERSEDENQEKRCDDISEWDREFLQVDQGTLFEIILAANYLDIKALLETSCKTVAGMIKGKTPQEIRKTFNIEPENKSEEAEQAQKESECSEEQ